jgi:hypothetical protein
MRILVILFGLCLIGAASGMDEFSQYLGKNVTVDACNLTAYEGTMVAEFPNAIVLKEICNPELGNVTIKKSCIVWIHEGIECGKWG